MFNCCRSYTGKSGYTAHKMRHGKEYDRDLVPWGCAAWYHDINGRKFDSNAKLGVVIGYGSSGSLKIRNLEELKQCDGGYSIITTTDFALDTQTFPLRGEGFRGGNSDARPGDDLEEANIMERHYQNGSSSSSQGGEITLDASQTKKRDSTTQGGDVQIEGSNSGDRRRPRSASENRGNDEIGKGSGGPIMESEDNNAGQQTDGKGDGGDAMTERKG